MKLESLNGSKERAQIELEWTLEEASRNAREEGREPLFFFQRLPLLTPTRCNPEWRANAHPMPARASQGRKLQKKIINWQKMSMQAGEERVLKALQDRLDYLENENRFRVRTVRTPATFCTL